MSARACKWNNNNNSNNRSRGIGMIGDVYVGLLNGKLSTLQKEQNREPRNKTMHIQSTNI